MAFLLLVGSYQPEYVCIRLAGRKVYKGRERLPVGARTTASAEPATFANQTYLQKFASQPVISLQSEILAFVFP